MNIYISKLNKQGVFCTLLLQLALSRRRQNRETACPLVLHVRMQFTKCSPFIKSHHDPWFISLKSPPLFPLGFLQHRLGIFLGENRQKSKPKNTMPGGDDNILAWLFHELG